MDNECPTFRIIGTSHEIALKMPSRNGADGELNKQLSLFSFWSDNYTVRDDGIQSQPLILNGIETTKNLDVLKSCFPICFPMCFTGGIKIYLNFKYLWEIMDKHEEVLVLDLGDCINAVYVIRKLSLKTDSRHGNKYFRWSMELEKVRDLTDEEKNEYGV